MFCILSSTYCLVYHTCSSRWEEFRKKSSEKKPGCNIRETGALHVPTESQSLALTPHPHPHSVPPTQEERVKNSIFINRLKGVTTLC